MKRLTVLLAALLVLGLAAPASATYYPPDVTKGSSWEWGKCRHHDAPWGEGRTRCRINAVLTLEQARTPENNGPSVVRLTPGDDVYNAGRGPDVIYGLAGDDRIWTGKGGPGDEVYGGRGADRINNWGSGNAPGLLDGGPGRDLCTGDRHDTFLRCERIRFK